MVVLRLDALVFAVVQFAKLFRFGVGLLLPRNQQARWNNESAEFARVCCRSAVVYAAVSAHALAFAAWSGTSVRGHLQLHEAVSHPCNIHM